MPNSLPDPMTVHPIAGYDKEIYVKPTLKNPQIVVGDFTYIADSDFESHVTHLYPWNADKLIIGKFCQIAAGVEFVMNGANHQMNAVSTFPFYTLQGWNMAPPAKENLPLKGDTVVGNDVWIGQNAVILPGVHIGDGAIIGLNSVVTKDVPPYVLAGREPLVFEGVNRVGLLRRGFSEEQVNRIKDIYEALYFQGMNVSQAVDYIEANFPATEERDTILGFIRESKRGIIPKPRQSR